MHVPLRLTAGVVGADGQYLQNLLHILSVSRFDRLRNNQQIRPREDAGADTTELSLAYFSHLTRYTF